MPRSVEQVLKYLSDPSIDAVPTLRTTKRRTLNRKKHTPSSTYQSILRCHPVREACVKQYSVLYHSTMSRYNESRVRVNIGLFHQQPAICPWLHNTAARCTTTQYCNVTQHQKQNKTAEKTLSVPTCIMCHRYGFTLVLVLVSVLVLVISFSNTSK